MMHTPSQRVKVDVLSDGCKISDVVLCYELTKDSLHYVLRARPCFRDSFAVNSIEWIPYTMFCHGAP